MLSSDDDDSRLSVPQFREHEQWGLRARKLEKRARSEESSHLGFHRLLRVLRGNSCPTTRPPRGLVVWMQPTVTRSGVREGHARESRGIILFPSGGGVVVDRLLNSHRWCYMSISICGGSTLPAGVRCEEEEGGRQPQRSVVLFSGGRANCD